MIHRLWLMHTGAYAAVHVHVFYALQHEATVMTVLLSNKRLFAAFHDSLASSY